MKKIIINTLIRPKAKHERTPCYYLRYLNICYTFIGEVCYVLWVNHKNLEEHNTGSIYTTQGQIRNYMLNYINHDEMRLIIYVISAEKRYPPLTPALC